ncbi:MAG: cupin domain-containing protein [candidate division WOR-3 bacterium]|nr:cupin domain-containing protein [Candidatus Omnitrophota bacterium]MCM8807853.1 cupin domain-containing protein [Candidatus Omnitrophota bacterium]
MIRRKNEMEIEEREKMRGGDGIIKILHFFKKEEFNANVRLCAKLIIPPFCSIGLHQHLDEDEVYIIVKGKGILFDGKQEHIVLEGDAILTGKGESHSIKNIGEDDLEIIAFISKYSENQKI